MNQEKEIMNQEKEILFYLEPEDVKIGDEAFWKGWKTIVSIDGDDGDCLITRDYIRLNKGEHAIRRPVYWQDAKIPPKHLERVFCKNMHGELIVGRYYENEKCWNRMDITHWLKGLPRL